MATATLMQDGDEKTLLRQAGAAVEAIDELLQQAIACVRRRVSDDDDLQASLLDQEQRAVHGLAWLATYVESLRQMQAWAERLHGDEAFGEREQLILKLAFSEYLARIAGGIPMNQVETVRLSDLGLPLDAGLDHPPLEAWREWRDD